MTSPERDRDGGVSAPEIRGALERVVASAPFRASPQLAAFLRFVVEAVLEGQAERLKGYTIAVEALRRPESFDPQTDPIVRVEAARLRRALQRYYADEGRDDPVIITLPRGTYVPTFALRAPVVHPAPPPPAKPARRPVGAALAIILLLVGAAMLWAAVHLGKPAAELDTTATAPTSPTLNRASPGLPTIAVEPFAVVAGGAGRPMPTSLLALHDRLRDALARFDEVHVISTVPGEGGRQAAAIYRLGASAQIHDDDRVTLTFRLIDSDDGAVVWSRQFEQLSLAPDPAPVEEAIVREVTTVLAQPYGVIHAREVGKPDGYGTRDPRYGCLLFALEYWRSYDEARHEPAHSCLQRITTLDPTYAPGFALLAIMYLEDHRGGNPHGDATPPLDRALAAARRAIELKPNSARAHQALMSVHTTRREFDAADAAGERARALNPYDPDVTAAYGATLIARGHYDRGLTLLRQSLRYAPVRPARIDVFLFFGHYMIGDIATAVPYAAPLPGDTYPLGLVARILAAHAVGDHDRARADAAQLTALRPAWRDDTRRELARFFLNAEVVERLARDLSAAGLSSMP